MNPFRVFVSGVAGFVARRRQLFVTAAMIALFVAVPQLAHASNSGSGTDSTTPTALTLDGWTASNITTAVWSTVKTMVITGAVFVAFIKVGGRLWRRFTRSAASAG